MFIAKGKTPAEAATVPTIDYSLKLALSVDNHPTHLMPFENQVEFSTEIPVLQAKS